MSTDLNVHVLYSQDESGSREDRTRRITTRFKGAVVSAVNKLNWGGDSMSFQVPKEAFNTPRSAIYAVVGYYSDGDTFGQTSGYIYIVDVYGNAEKAYATAEALRKEAAIPTNESIFGNQRFPWGGYFASLESVEVEILPIISMENDATVTKNPNDLPSW